MFLDFPSSLLVVDDERQAKQYDEGGEDGEKQDCRPVAGLAPAGLNSG